MHSIVMAGGQGSRLRPLTCNIPKPMVKLCGKPILQYILDLLQKHNFSSVNITVNYLATYIKDHFPSQKYKNLSLSFFDESFPLGTAGSVKNASKNISDDFLVISGDAITDCNLSQAMQFHKQNHADATIIIKNVIDPREYGLVNIDQNFNITGFLEKPGYSQVNTNTANTGIYILNPNVLTLIPDNTECDFAKDIFPKMLNLNMKLLAFKSDFYWCDIGDLNSFLNCQKDILNKKVNCYLSHKFDANGNIFKSSKPLGSYKISPPVYIGENVKIETGATINSGTVIEDNSIIGENVKISGSNIQERSFINDFSSLTNSIICIGATIKKNCHIFEGSTIGFNSIIGNSSTVYPGVKIWPQKLIPDNMIISDNIKFSSIKKDFFDDLGICGDAGIELTPEFLVKFGCALGSISSNLIIAVGSNDTPFAVSLKNALISGIQSSGTQVWNFGNNFESLFTFAMSKCNLNLGIFINGTKDSIIKVFSDSGLPLNRQLERSLETSLSNGEFIRCRWNDFLPTVDMSGFLAIYMQYLKDLIPFGLKGLNVSIKSKNPLIQSSFNNILSQVGANISDDLVISINYSGTSLSIISKSLRQPISYWQVFALCCLSEFEKGYDISIPSNAPHIIDKIAQSFNTKVLRYYSCPADNSDQVARNLAKKQLWVRDALMLSIKFLSFFKSSGKSISQLDEILPKFALSSKSISCNSNNISSILNSLTSIDDLNYAIADGILINYKNGSAFIKPFKRGNGFSILAEASKTEFANEICDQVSNIIEKIKSNH